MHDLKNKFPFIALTLVLTLIPLSVKSQDDPLLLEYQGSARFGGVYWEGFGLKVTWDPDIRWSYFETPLSIFSSDEVDFSLRSLEIEITDSTVLTQNEDQWVTANRKPTLTKQIGDVERSFHSIQYRHSIDKSVDGSGDVEKHLFQSEPFPIYVYGTKGTEGTEVLRFGQEIYGFYEEYLVKTVYAQVSYSGEPEQWFNNRLQLRRDDYAEQRQEVLFGWSVGLGFSVLAAIILWALRYRISAFLYWIKHSLVSIVRRLFNLLKRGRRKSPELQELEVKVKLALQREDYDEATRLADLAERIKKIDI